MQSDPCQSRLRASASPPHRLEIAPCLSKRLRLPYELSFIYPEDTSDAILRLLGAFGVSASRQFIIVNYLFGYRQLRGIECCIRPIGDKPQRAESLSASDEGLERLSDEPFLGFYRLIFSFSLLAPDEVLINAFASYLKTFRAQCGYPRWLKRPRNEFSVFRECLTFSLARAKWDARDIYTQFEYWSIPLVESKTADPNKVIRRIRHSMRKLLRLAQSLKLPNEIQMAENQLELALVSRP